MSSDWVWTNHKRATALDLRRGDPLGSVSAETVEKVLEGRGWQVAVIESGGARHIDLLVPRDESVPVDLERALAGVRRLARQYERQHRAGSPDCFDEAGRHRGDRCDWTTRSKNSQDVLARLAKKQRRAAGALERYIDGR